MRKIIFPATLCLLFNLTVIAQTGAKLELVPDKVMNAEFQALDGSSPIRLGLYRNRVTIIVLWASWCGPCLMALNKLNQLNREFAARGVEVIGLVVEDPQFESEIEKVQAFVRESKISFQVGWMDAEMVKALTKQTIIPQLYVIAGDGVIVKKFMGWTPSRTTEMLRQAVEEARTNPPVRQ
jgi:thiol-disulfide isomerase/thioredoxin